MVCNTTVSTPMTCRTPRCAHPCSGSANSLANATRAPDSRNKHSTNGNSGEKGVEGGAGSAGWSPSRHRCSSRRGARHNGSMPLKLKTSGFRARGTERRSLCFAAASAHPHPHAHTRTHEDTHQASMTIRHLAACMAVEQLCRRPMLGILPRGATASGRRLFMHRHLHLCNQQPRTATPSEQSITCSWKEESTPG